jgi:hypothetical protein
LEQIICSEDFGDFDELVVVVVAVEEGFFAEDHGCEHCSETPHVQGVIWNEQSLEKQQKKYNRSGGEER